MKLSSPEKTAEGYKFGFIEKCLTPELDFDGSNWIVTTEWIRVTEIIRGQILTQLFDSRSVLFKSAPSLKTLESLFHPWITKSDNGNYEMKLQMPLPSDKPGKGILDLSGILMKRDSIVPIWNIQSYTENTPVVDFVWDNDEPENEELREVTFFESAGPSDTSNVIQLYTDEEYTARKFAAKDRVKEARLKAILARRAAEVETTRFFNEYNFGENESTFSEYDISDFSDDEEETEAEENGSG